MRKAVLGHGAKETRQVDGLVIVVFAIVLWVVNGQVDVIVIAVDVLMRRRLVTIYGVKKRITKKLSDFEIAI